MPGKVRCKPHGGASTGPKFWDGKQKSLDARVEGRKRWVEWMRSQGLKFPCGRKTKGTQEPVLVGKALLAQKAMQATAARIRRARTKLEIAEQLQDRLASEAAARAKAEHDKLLGLAPPSPGPSPDQPFINWDAVAKRAINAQFAERCHAQWIRNGGASVDERGRWPASRACSTIRACSDA